jgi:hypothetical protein
MLEIERMLALLKRPTRLWRVDEAAFLCDCSRYTIYRAINAGKINPSRKRIPHSEVVRYCGGRDPLLEFELSIQGKTNLRQTIEQLQNRVAQIRATVEA